MGTQNLDLTPELTSMADTDKFVCLDESQLDLSKKVVRIAKSSVELDAEKINVADTGGKYTATEVEGVLAEIADTDATQDSGISDNASDISSLQSDLSTAEGNISTLQSDMSTAQSDISTLDGEVVKITGNQSVAGVKTFSEQIVSSVATGTAPLSVASTTKVVNLNVDKLDDLDSSQFLRKDQSDTMTGSFNATAHITAAETVKVGTTSETAADMGAGAVRWNSSTGYLEVSNGTDWIPAGRGMDYEGYNLPNRNFEVNIDGYDLYDDGAVAEPVDGTGGTATILSLSAETSNALIGTKSLKISKSAFNGQGEGVSCSDFSIDIGQLGRVCCIPFNYLTTTNYVSGDSGFFIYDVDNSNLMYPSISDIPATYGEAAQFYCCFMPSDSLNYRLIWHIKTTNALAYDIILDNVQPAAQLAVFSTAIAGPFSYTPTVVGLGTPTNVIFNWWRVGNRMIIDGDLTVGATSADLVYFTVPEGYTVKANSLPSSVQMVGRLVRSENSPNAWHGLIVDGTISYQRVYVTYNNAGPDAYTKVGGTTLAAPGDRLYFHAEIEISTWTNDINLIEGQTEYASNSSSTDADDTVSPAYVYGIQGATGVLGTTTITSPRKKQIEFKYPFQPGDVLDFMVSSPGSNVFLKDPVISSIPIVQGYTYVNEDGGVGFEYVDEYHLNMIFYRGPYGDSTSDWSSLPSGCRWFVRKSKGCNPGEVPKVVYVEYYNQTVTAAATDLKYTSITDDTHVSYDTATGRCYSKVSGIFSGTMTITPSAATVQDIELYKNGVLYKPIGATNSTKRYGFSFNIRLDLGDYFTFQATNNVAAGAADSFSVTRLGS